MPGRLKAGFADYPILAYNLKQGGFPEVRLVESYKPATVGSVGIGVRKGDTELLAKINASLAKLKANGTIDKILEKWGLKAQGCTGASIGPMKASGATPSSSCRSC